MDTRSTKLRWLLPVFGVMLVVSVVAIASNGANGAGASLSELWGRCFPERAQVSSTGIPAVDFFTGNGEYMPRTHCMVNAQGETDWAWVWSLVLLNGAIIFGYLRIFVFWRRTYLQEQERDRNKKLMDLAWIFLLCAGCGYIASIMLFFWPGYRLLALSLLPLAIVTWKFAANLDEFKISLSAKRLSRELDETLELQNERLTQEVELATQDLQLARDEAMHASAAKSEFLARMSHEIRTPMSAILGYVDLALEEQADESARIESLKTVQRNSNHLLKLINDVLDVSKIEAGEMTYENVSVSPKSIIDDIVKLMRPQAERKGLMLESCVASGVPSRIKTDPTRVRQMITNIVGNAIKFTDQGSVRVVVSASNQDETALCIQISDTGIGMTHEQISGIFDPFTQAADNTTRLFGGTGLGLTIARQIARDLGGDLAAQSKPNVGSTFTATIRYESSDASIETPCGTAQNEPASDELPLENRRVLLVEDGDDNHTLIKHRFKKVGVEIDRACDGLEGLKSVCAAQEHNAPYEIILMDINMPNLDGVETTRRLRELGFTTPIVMLTAHALPEERARAMGAGADSYCTKPIDFPKLFAVCRTLIAENEDLSRAA